ncbi:MAG: carbohydrate binding family 9 domain-containing protein [Thermoanaerobaculaceae bacterium]|nr:carbohydrate binding family 9 domain-containing protein [Thermoanaerobaculaceae bacterium]
MSPTSRCTAWLLAILVPVAAAEARTRAQNEAAPAKPPTHRVTRASGPVKVDARLDEAAWTTALTLELAFEVQPGENVPPPVRTEFLITYDTDNLYLGFRAFDPEPGKIRAHITDRDRAYRDDFVGVIFDTFNDKRRGYEFFVNPLGVQMDLSRNEMGGGDNSEDDTWDAIWSSAGRITAEGYEVELAIPFSSLRFPKIPGEHTWRIAPFRAYPRSVRHQIFLMPTARDNNCFFCQVPMFVGFEGIRPGRNIEVDPTLTTQRTDELEDTDDLTTPFHDGSFETKAGVSARWGVTPNISLNAALNPDFSQVEADSAQLSTNTRYALFYPEKRPFFLEGADIFSTPITASYTRTVADPRWGAKVSGKAGANAVGVFVAQDRTTNLLFPSNAGSDLDTYEESNTSGVVRYRRDIGKSSALGVIATSREGSGYSNKVYGADGIIRISDQDTARFQILASRTKYPGQLAEEYDQPTGEFDGSAFFGILEHNTRTWDAWVWHERYTTGFRADLGFIPRVDAATSSVGGQYKILGSAAQWFTRLTFGAEPWQTTDHTGRVTDQAIPFYFNYQGPLQSTVNIRVARAKEYYDGVTYDQDRLFVFYNLRLNGTFTTSLDTRFGDTIDYDNSRPARVTHLAPGFTLDLGRHLALTVDDVFEDLDVSGGRLYRANLLQMKAVYQLNTRAFVRLIVQYLDLRRNLDLYLDPPDSAVEREVFSQLMFSYKLNPQTVFFLGYSDSRGEEDHIAMMLKSRTVFAKIGYAWLL